MLPLSANVPAAKLSVPPLATLNEPAHAAVQLPPPKKFRVPALAFTVPVLLNTTLTVFEIPPVIWNVPALLNVGVPPLKMMPFPKVHTAPTRLLITAPFCRTRLAPTAVLPKVVAPETLSVRVSRSTCPEGRLIPPLALVAPAPLIVPPVQVSKPVRVTLPVPDRAPPLKFVAPCTVLAPFSVSVPPVMFKTLANVATPVTVSGPEAKVIVELATKLAMVWLAGAREPMVMVEPEKVVWMHTLSVAIGTAPVLQLPAVPHWLSAAPPVHRLAPAAQPAVALTDKTTEVGV